MSHDVREICSLCAWRAHCAKRFSRGGDSTLHCPDFSEDVLLRKQLQRQNAESDSADRSS